MTMVVMALAGVNAVAAPPRFESLDFAASSDYTQPAILLNGDGSHLVTIGWDGVNPKGLAHWSDCAGLQIQPGLLNSPNSEVTDLSPNGDWVVGYSHENDDGIDGAFRMSRDGDIQVLGIPPFYTAAWARAVSDDGTIVMCDAGPNIYRWTADDGFTLIDLTSAGIERPDVLGMLGDGSVIIGKTGQDVFYWSATDGVSIMGHLKSPTEDNYYETELSAISADGNVVVGSSLYDNDLNGRAFRWTKATGMIPLDDDPDTYFAWPSDVSADGNLIVGGIGRRHGAGGYFIWDPTHGTRLVRDALLDYGLADDINGWVIDTVFAVSDNGNVLVGGGIRPDGVPSLWRVVINPDRLPTPVDSDGDGVCDERDACEGDDSSGDTDGDGLCDDTDDCVDGDCALSDATDCPADIVVAATSEEGAIVEFALPTMIPSSQKSLFADRSSGSMFPVGVTDVTVYVVDSAHPEQEAVACTFSVEVQPAASPPPAGLDALFSNGCFPFGAELTLLAPIAIIGVRRRGRDRR